MLTGSHNPASHNGLKIVINGDTLYGDRITALQERIRNKAFSEGKGREEERDITDRYLTDVTSDIVLARPLKIAIDCGNGAGGELAPQLFKQLGCEVTPLYTEIDGNFPNHAPDPGNPDNCPVWQFHMVYSDDNTRQWVKEGCTSAGIGCLDCKKPVIEAVQEELEPIRKRAEEHLRNPDLVRTLVAEGCEEAREAARATLEEVRAAMGLNYR